MQIYLFASNSYPSVSAFTSDETGGNLPPDYAPWFSVRRGRTLHIEAPSNHIAAAIQRDGFFLLAASGHAGGKWIRN